MMTWRLWAALNTPPADGPFYHYLLRRARGTARPAGRRAALYWLAAATLLGLGWSFLLEWWPLLLVGLVLAANTACCMVWVVNISSSVALEKECRRYELIAALPAGPLGAAWGLGRVQMWCDVRLLAFYTLLRVGALVMLSSLVVLLLALLFLLGPGMAARSAAPALALLLATAAAAAFYLDHIQSCVLAMLCGLIGAAGAQHPQEARPRAAAFFLGPQVLLYAAVLLGLPVLLPQAYAQLSLSGVLALLLAGLALLALLRELLIRRLLARLLDSSNTDRAEFDALCAVL